MNAAGFTIGILGGMGPRATVEFERRLIDILGGKDQDMPRIITINDGTTWDRTEFLLSDGNDPLEQLVPNARLLYQARVDVVCLPCNTAHAPSILARLQGVVPLPIIDMPSVCIERASQAGVQKLLILGTDGTRQSGVYQSRNVACRILLLSDAEQLILTEVIDCLKRGQFIPIDTLQRVSSIIASTYCDGVVLACTELSLIKERLGAILENVTVFDSTDELARRCVSLYNERKEYSI